MASVTLAESAKLSQNELVAGLIENVITVDRFFELVPFDMFDGNALAYNRENALGDVMVAGVGTAVTAKSAATFTKIAVELTTIIGDAEVNGLIQTTRSGKTDQTALQIASKAKSAGRKYEDMLINGTGSANQFTGLINLCASGQKVATGSNGGPLSFPFLDELLDLVVDKDGQVDYIIMPARTIRSYKALVRGLGGAAPDDAYTLPSGKEIIAYSGVPIFRNDWIPVNQTKGSGSAQTTIFAGTFDDGSRKYGLAGLTAEKDAGLSVVDVGEKESYDEHIWRVRWYASLALFSELGLSAAEGITN